MIIETKKNYQQGSAVIYLIIIPILVAITGFSIVSVIKIETQMSQKQKTENLTVQHITPEVKHSRTPLPSPSPTRAYFALVDEEIATTPTPTPFLYAGKDLKTLEYVTYRSEHYGIEFKYPKDWEINPNEYLENHELFSASHAGPTQGEGTEWYDGVFINVYKPVESEKSLEEWIEENYPSSGSDYYVHGEEKIGDQTFKTAKNMYYTPTKTYIYKQGNKIYQIHTFAQGQEEEIYQKILNEIILSFKAF